MLKFILSLLPDNWLASLDEALWRARKNRRKVWNSWPWLPSTEPDINAQRTRLWALKDTVGVENYTDYERGQIAQHWRVTANGWERIS